MTATMTLARPSRGRRTQLDDILLGSNPTADSRWTRRTGTLADIASVGFVEDGHWSVSCNLDRIGAGTVGWFARTGDGGSPPLAGFIVCTDVPFEERVEDDDGPVCDATGAPVFDSFVPGPLHGWGVGLWLPGTAIDKAGWPATRSPWGASSVRQFQNGQHLAPDLVDVILSVLPESLARTVALEHREVTGADPWWW